MTNYFPPSRAAGLARLASFAERAGGAYAMGRNIDTGRDQPSHVSRLSPYLRYRLITEQEVIKVVLSRNSAATADKYIQEVLWRTYWKGWLERHPAVWTRFLTDLDHQRDNFRDRKAVDDAENGRTGIEGFDDWAVELQETGYLHNHARMWFASIWIFTLGLPWVLGADFFMRHLIDADPASNTLSWRWVAGLQTPGKTYLATKENIARYTNGRFAPDGLATFAPALSESPIEAMRSFPEVVRLEETEPFALLLTHEDLSPETLPLKKGAVDSIIVCADTSSLCGEASQQFVKAAVSDTAARACDNVQCPTRLINTLDAAHLIEAMRDRGTRHIVTPYAPVGPMADALATVRSELGKHDITLSLLPRAWDTRLWPQAKAGFFTFKKTIPPILKALGIT